MAHEEYLRRNKVHASAIGADAAIRVALNRLLQMKNPPKWLIEVLLGAKERTEILPAELARWRDEAHDRPPVRPHLHRF